VEGWEGGVGGRAEGGTGVGGGERTVRGVVKGRG